MSALFSFLRLSALKNKAQESLKKQSYKSEGQTEKILIFANCPVFARDCAHERK